MRLQLDGARVHYNRNIKPYLNEHFAQSWIGRGGYIIWHPRWSPNLNPLEFFLRDIAKNLFIKHPEITLSVKIMEPKISFVTIESLLEIRRCRLCVQNNGGHFEHQLWTKFWSYVDTFPSIYYTIVFFNFQLDRV